MQFLKFRSLLPVTVFALLCGCSMVEEEKITLDGERISVLEGRTALQPDYAPGEVKIVLPAPYVNTAWSQSGGNATHMMGHLSSDSKLKELWESGFGEGSSKRDFLIAAPVSAHKAVFTIDADGIVSAFRLDDGRKIWKRRSGKSFSPLKPANVQRMPVWRTFSGITEQKRNESCILGIPSSRDRYFLALA